MEKSCVDNLSVYLTPYDDIFKKDVKVEKIKVDLIYFDHDKSEITARAEIELHKVLFAMQQFQELRI